MAIIEGNDQEFTTAATPVGPDAPCASPIWRFVITDRESNTTAVLDKIAADRHVEPLLNQPSWLSMTVPSDSILVNLIYTPDGNGDPKVAEGDRLVYGFRKESSEIPYFTCRAAGTILQVEDTAQQDDARTKLVAWDPWKLAAFRPARGPGGQLPPPMTTMGDEAAAAEYPPGTSVGDIVVDQLTQTTVYDGPMCVILGDVEATGAWSDEDPYTIEQGMSVADVWTAMVSTFLCDIILTPLYEPDLNPGVTHVLNIYNQVGEELPDDIFGWDAAPHSLTQISRVKDGTTRANRVQLAAGQSGAYGIAVLQEDDTSRDKYGAYWAQQVLPGVISPTALYDIALFQLHLRTDGRTIVQMSPTPERSPCPFVEYNLGDIVHLYARASEFRQELGGVGPMQNVRIYGFPLDISDDALETVTGMILLGGGN
jgi:hypothetical protein